jgi:hypothetical protein
MSDDQTKRAQTTELLRRLNADEARGNIAWWTNLRNEHAARGEMIAVGKCQEEIDLWTQELEDHG